MIASDPRRAFTLVELLVVVAIVTLLIAMLLPAARRARYEAVSASCGAGKRQLAASLITYAGDHHGFFPFRYHSPSTGHHPFWFGQRNSPQDMHDVFESYVGQPRGDGPPDVLVCPVNEQAIWDEPIAWPMGNLYRGTVAVYAGWNWRTNPPGACEPLAPLEDMPLRVAQAMHRPLAGDLVEYMTNESFSGYTGWVTPHSYEIAYHVRGQNPETPPPDPIPFAFGDGSVVFTRDLDECYRDLGYGVKFWTKR